MADIMLKSLKFPGLDDKYLIPQIDNTLTQNGKAADAKKTGDELATKANQDGYYSDMTAGNAEQIVATKGAFENTPYIFRKTGGGISVNDRVAEELVGGTVAWNQIAKNDTAPTDRNGMTITGSESGFTINGTASASTSATGWFHLGPSHSEYTGSNGHKILISFKLISGSITPASGNTETIWFTYGGSTAAVGIGSEKIVSPVLGSTSKSSLDVANGTVFSNAKIGLNCFDLTRLFGSAIADYIYGLETAHAGDGVAFFRKLFPKDYYAYDAGSLQSVQAAKHITTGFNQWDEEWEVGGFYSADGTPNTETNRIRSKNYIRVIGGATYYVAGARITWFEYDANKTYLRTGNNSSYVGANATFVPSSDCSYIRFQTASAYGNVYHNDICINLSNASRNGEYEPYAGHEYPLGEVTLRGIPKLEDGKLYYDGDTYKSDGTVTRKYGIVDLGTLGWSYYSNIQTFYAKIGSGYYNYQGVCSKYPKSLSTAAIGDKTWGCNAYVGSNMNVLIKDTDYSDAATFKTAMSGVYLVYELETPTTETSDTFTSPQVVDGAGTELYTEFGTRDVAVPVGHNSIYAVDLRLKLENAPDNPASDGTYLVKHENGENTYVHSDAFDKNGVYGNLTVGNAEQLVSSIGEEDEVPYNFRTAGGAIDIGDRLTEKIVGGTVAWNQVVVPGRVASRSQTLGITISANTTTGEITVSGTATATNNLWFVNHFEDIIGNGHVFLLRGSKSSSHGLCLPNTSIKDTGTGVVFKTTASDAYQLAYYFTQGDVINETLHPEIFDLTQMFGSTIADYIYSLETANAGAGVAWFKKLFPKPYYPYNAGELMSVKISAHKTTGFNQWDEEWLNGYYNPSTGVYTSSGSYICSKNAIRVIPSTVYYIKTSGVAFEIYEYDANGTFLRQLRSAITDATFTTDADAYYIHIGSHVNSAMTSYDPSVKPICINYHWDGERDGEYEPYEENVYPLDSDLELRGIPKLDSGNNLYYDGDTYESDGTVTRRYGIVDLGTLNWFFQADNRISAGRYYYASIPLVPGGFNYVLSKYCGYSKETLTHIIEVFGSSVDKISWNVASNPFLYVIDSTYTSVTDFKTAMSGVYLVCELETPTTESADPYQNPQIVDDFGTEEYVDERTVAIPVGHESFYAANLKAKLEMAPDSPDGNGDYIVRQTNGVNEYVPLVIPNELPTVPDTDGAYVLRCTINNGTATYSWVSAT